MTITRDGKEIQLTAEEVRNAYFEQLRQNHIDDVDCALQQHPDSKVQELDIEGVTDLFERFLDKSDRYGAYFDCLDCAIEEALSEIE